MKKEKILKRIKNLLELADDQNSVAEAESAAKKAQLLIMKYNIEESDLRGGEAATIEESTFHIWEIQKAQEGKWMRGLFSSIAEFNFCEVLYGKKYIKGERRDVLYILGDPANVEMVKYLGEQLVHRLRSIRKQEWNNYYGPEGYHMFLRGFFSGAARGIRLQLKENQQQFSEDESTALVIQKNNEALDLYIKEKYPNLGSARRTGSSSNHGYSSGIKAGKNMNINAGLRGKNGSLQLGG